MRELYLSNNPLEHVKLKSNTTLKVLHINSTRVASLEGLPAGLEVLKAVNSPVRRVRGLPAGLRELDLAVCPVERLELPAALEALNLCRVDIAELPPLPAGLKRLDLLWRPSGDLRYSGVESLPRLPAALEGLWVDGCAWLKAAATDPTRDPMAELEPLLPAGLSTLDAGAAFAHHPLVQRINSRAGH